jgi:hypothetical protein
MKGASVEVVKILCCVVMVEGRGVANFGLYARGRGPRAALFYLATLPKLLINFFWMTLCIARGQRN